MKNKSFVRKIMYLVIIGALVIPLSLISRPASQGTQRDDEGGKLAQLRTEYNLSQANLMEIDPASETMKLATLGLRGVAVNALWMQAMEHRKRENWDGLASTLQALIKVQPNFVKVWEYQAHNLSYNISMEFDDYEYRYHWVKKGIDFLEEGIPYNRKDHRMLDNLGFFTGMKIGRSDERFQFRRMFREDADFHESMAHIIDPSRYEEGDYGYDNWLMAWCWYDESRKLVSTAGVPQLTSDVLYYAKRPAQLRNEAQSLKDEYKTDIAIQDIWERSREAWIDYGRMQITNSRNVSITLEGMLDYSEELERKRAELDAMAPGVRSDITEELMDRLGISEEEQAILDKPIAERTDEEAAIANRLNLRILQEDNIIDVRVLSEVPEEQRMAGRRIVDEIMDTLMQMRSIEQQDSVSNYRYWRERTECEASEICVRARRALYDAQQMAKRSVFDDEYILDRETGERRITQKGAITLYEEAFELWREVFEANQRMRGGELGDSIATELVSYMEMLEISGIEWKDDFPLQDFIDTRVSMGDDDGLPTTQFLEERRADREEELEEQRERQQLEEEAAADAADDDAGTDEAANDEAGGDDAGNESGSEESRSEESEGDSGETADEESADENSGDDSSAAEESGGEESGSEESGSEESGSEESGSEESGETADEESESADENSRDDSSAVEESGGEESGGTAA